VDTHVFNHCEISPFYDSLIGKLVVWAEDRHLAIQRMQKALSEFRIEGIKSTLPFHQRVLQDKDFIQGDIDTHFLEKPDDHRR
jgi:acetyl-CoA carboxylase biotin carboxylase subunit